MSRILSRILSVAAVAGASLTVLAAPALAGTGNSVAARTCQMGGYAHYQGIDGTRFTNADDCTSYAARGGTLIPIPIPPPTVTISFLLVNTTSGGVQFDHCILMAHVSGFTPNTTYTFSYTVDNGPGGSAIFTTDALGSAVISTGSTYGAGASIIGTVNGVSSISTLAPTLASC